MQASRVSYLDTRHGVAAETAQCQFVVANVTQRLVAVEAENAAHLAGRVIVVDVLRWPGARGAGAALRFDHRVDVGRRESVAAAKVILPAAAVQPFGRRLAPRVVAGLAVSGETVPR